MAAAAEYYRFYKNVSSISNISGFPILQNTTENAEFVRNVTTAVWGEDSSEMMSSVGDACSCLDILRRMYNDSLLRF